MWAGATYSRLPAGAPQSLHPRVRHKTFKLALNPFYAWVGGMRLQGLAQSLVWEAYVGKSGILTAFARIGQMSISNLAVVIKM